MGKHRKQEEPKLSGAFISWCNQLDSYAKSQGFLVKKSYTIDTGRECWLSYYEDGLTPKEALEEDFKNS